MPAWRPIATLINRKACTAYLVATRNGEPRLLWWCEDDAEWLGDSDREDKITESEVVLWYDLPKPCITK